MAIPILNDIRLYSGGKLYLWTGHNSNFLKYNLWQASASGGMTIKNTANNGSIIFQTESTTVLTLDGSQNATFAGTITTGDNGNDNYISATFSDSSYTRIHGYGLYMSRDNSYIRPTTDTGKTLYIGSSDKRWDNVNVHATNATFSGAIEASGGLFFKGDTHMGFVPYPKGAQYRSDNSSDTGYILIKLPTDISNSPDDMISFYVDIYDYTTNEMISVFVGGYNYRHTPTSSNWYNCTAIINTKRQDKDFNVRFGHDGTNYYVAIGETTSVWAHPSIVVRDFQCSYRGDAEHYVDGWAISTETATLSGVDETQSGNLPSANGTFAGNLNVNGRISVGGTHTANSQVHIKNTSGDNRGLLIENLETASYAEIAVKSDLREFRLGTGGDGTNNANAENLFYIYDATTGGGAGHRFEINSNGDVQARRPRSNTAGDIALSLQPTDSTIHYGFRIDQATNSINLDRVDSAGQLLRVDTSGNATFTGIVSVPTGKSFRLYNAAGSGWGEITLNETDNKIQFNRGITPSGNEQADQTLGLATKRWHTVYAHDGDFSGDATFAGDVHIGSGSPNGVLDIHASNGNWRINDYGGMYFRNSSNATHESYIHPRSDGGLSIGRVAESNWAGSGTGTYAATTYDHLIFDTSSNATFAGIVKGASVLVGQASQYSPTGGGDTLATFTGSGNDRQDIVVSNQTNHASAAASLVLATHGHDFIIKGTSSAGGSILSLGYNTTPFLSLTNTAATFAGNVTSAGIIKSNTAEARFQLTSTHGRETVLNQGGGNFHIQPDHGSGVGISYGNTSHPGLLKLYNNTTAKITLDASGGDATFAGKITASGDPGVVVTGSGNSTIHVASTGTGLAGMYMDASNGDFIGSDYVFVGQDNDKTFRLESFNSSGDILLKESNINTLRLSGGDATFGGDVSASQILFTTLNGHAKIDSQSSSIFIEASNIQAMGNLIPDGTGNRNLGASNRYWAETFTNGVTSGGNITINSNTPVINLGVSNTSTGNSKINFFSKNNNAANAYSLQFNKDTGIDRLEFIDGSGNANIKFNNGGSASFAGDVVITTQSAGDNSTKAASTAFVTTAVSNIVNSAPSTLDTLNELAAALGDDANFSTTVTNSIATKLPLTAGSTNKLTGTLYIQGTNTTNAESVLLRGVSSNDGDFLGSIRTANTGGYNQEMRFYTSNANGTTDEDLTLTLKPDQSATFAGNIIAEDSEVHVGDTSGDSWTRILHAQADGYGFDWQHNNATVLVNEQGSTNQALVLGDVDAGDVDGLFGIAHKTASTSWAKVLNLKGNGELYIGSAGTSQVYHEGHKPTLAELGAASSSVVNQSDFVSAANGGSFAAPITISGGGNTLMLKKGTGTPAIAFAGTATDPEASALIEGVAGGGLKIYTSTSTAGTIADPGWSTKLTIAQDGLSTFTGDVVSPGIYVGSRNASFDFYNNGTTYLNGAVTVDAAFTQSGGGASTFSGSLTIPDYINHTGDSGTKFGFSADDTFVVRTGGAVRLTVNDDVVNAHEIITSGNQNSNNNASGADGRYATGILDLSSGSNLSAGNNFRIETNIPFNSGGADFTVTIQGFQYGSRKPVNLTICWHIYPANTPYNYCVISHGGWSPVIKMARNTTTNNVTLLLETPGYWPKMYVKSLHSSNYEVGAYAKGWTWANGTLASGYDIITTIPYQPISLGNGGIVNGGAINGDTITGTTLASTGNANIAGDITVGDSHFIGDDADDNLLIQSSSGENLIINGNGRVLLQDGGSTKLETSSAGVAVAGNLEFVGDALISSDTNDASDNSQIIITGGGASGDTRGASVHLSGNEHGNAGLLQLRAGDGATGGIRLYEGGSERMRIAAGKVIMSNTGSTGTASGLLHLKGTGDAIRVESTNTGAGGAQIDLLHFTTSPDDEDTHAVINMGGYYSGSTSVYGTQIKSIWTDVSERHSRLEFTTCDTTVGTALTLAHDKSATFAGEISQIYNPGNTGAFQFHKNANAGDAAYTSKKWQNDDAGFGEIWRNSSTRSATGQGASSFNMYNSADINFWAGSGHTLNLSGTNATFAGRINSTRAPGSNNTDPTISLGDGNTGFYERSDNDLRVTLGGVNYWEFSANCMGNVNEGKAHFNSETATATNPSIIPWRNDADTGIGRGSANVLSLIAGGVEALSLGTTDATFSGNVTLNTGTAKKLSILASTHDTNTAQTATLELGYTHSGGAAAGNIVLTEAANNAFDADMTFGLPYNNGSGGSTTRTALTLDGGTLAASFAGAIDATGHIQAFTRVYLRESIQLLNKAADGWLFFATRNTSASEAVYDISNVGTLSTAGDATFGGNVNLSTGKNIFISGGSGLRLLHDGTNGHVISGTGQLKITNSDQDEDILFRGNDGGSTFTALTLDMSEAGYATFNSTIKAPTLTGVNGLGATVYTINSTGVVLHPTGSVVRAGTGTKGVPSFSFVNDTDTGMYSDGANAIKFTAGGNDLLGINTTAGVVAVTGQLTTSNGIGVAGGHVSLNDDVQLQIGSSNDLKIFHNATDSFIINEVGNLKITNGANDKDIIFESDDGLGGTTEYFRVDGGESNTIFSRDLKFLDSGLASRKAIFGTGSDLQIYHDASNSYIKNNGGDLYIQQNTNDGDIIFQSDNGSGGSENYIKIDGGNRSIIVTAALGVYHNDGIASRFGDAGDLQLFHNGSNSHIQNATGDLYVENLADDKDIIFRCDDGSGGFATYFFLDGSQTNVNFQKDAIFTDNIKALFGGSGDLQIYHNASNSYINDTGTGDLYIQASDNMYFQTYGSGKRWITLNENASVDLFYNDSKKFETTNTGVAVTGNIAVTGTTDGVDLSNYPTQPNQLTYQTLVAHFSQTAGSTSTFNIPMNNTTESTTATYYHVWTAPFNGQVKTMIMKHAHGTSPDLISSTPTKFRVAVNGTSADYTSSSFLTRVRVEGRSDDYYSYIKDDNINQAFSAGDRVYFQFLNASTSVRWRNCSVSIVVEYNIT